MAAKYKKVISFLLVSLVDFTIFIIEAHGTDVSVGVRLLSGETLLQEKNSTGRR